MTTSISDPFELAPIDNMMPRVHFNRALFFPASHYDPNIIFCSLKVGLARAFQILPLLSGTLKVNPNGTQRGRLVVTGPWMTADEAFSFIDLRDHIEFDYASLRAKHFPTSQWSIPTASKFFNIPSFQDSEQPVLRAALASISGGFVFSLSLHHSFTDGNGAAAISRLWCSCCEIEAQSEVFDAKLVLRDQLMAAPNLAGIEEFPGLTYDAQADKQAQASSLFANAIGPVRRWLKLCLETVRAMFQRTNQALQASAGKNLVRGSAPLQPNLATRVLFFSQAKLLELKTLASNCGQFRDIPRWISTQDALFSLLWCSFVTARRSCGRPTASDSHRQYLKPNHGYQGDELAGMAIAMNVRHLLRPPISPDFIGNVLQWAGIVAPLDQLKSTPECLSAHAYKIREIYRGVDLPYLQRFISALGSVHDISKVNFAQMPRQELGLGMTSWRDQSTYTENWGKVFGSDCDRVRWLGPLTNGLAIIMPELAGSACKSSAAGLEVTFGVLEDALPYLQQDELLNHFAEWR